ncbi:unnamed protein product [Onchocerca flexuosa]|uniref:Uncharacterized protein n=1 Tax=Onchocerca flexuosa TaxID=387005 RepID=A0A183HAA8_9BILA|nr:unnamed protein product [Onchocerca flexuosa]
MDNLVYHPKPRKWSLLNKMINKMIIIVFFYAISVEIRRLKDVPKGKVFENKEKKERNEDFSVKNPMPHEDADVKILSMTDSTMIPIYKRTEFYVLSGGVALYWVILIFIGLIIAICRNKFRRAKDEHKGHQKNEKKDERTEDV